MIFFKQRKKLEPRRRFGTKEFRTRVKKSQNYKRAFDINKRSRLAFFLPKISWQSKFWRYLGLIVFLVIFYFLVISSYFSVTNITLTGNKQVTLDQVEQVIKSAQTQRLFLIRKNNLFLMSRGRVNQLLTENLSAIKKVVKYKRIWPNKVEIEIKERTAAFVIKSNDKYFLVDDEGMVVRELSDPEKFLVAVDQVVEDFAQGEPLPNPKLATFILTAVGQWGTKINTPITEVKFPGKASEDISFVSSEGWTVFFDLNRSSASQISNLALILNKQILPQDRAKLAYVDLRLLTTAYYCFKNSPCTQQPPPEETTPPVKP